MKQKDREADALYWSDLQAIESNWLYFKVMGEINPGI
jgi:hypothetical protein